MKNTIERIISSPAFHALVLLIGAAFLLTGAFHENLWFDESYSVAIADHSFAEIWHIGSGDVHPVLFYWALHIIRLLGGYVTEYRIFTVLGAVALAAIGLTHLRRDFGWRVGLIYTTLALFTPYVSYIAIEIRMYSWAACMVMLSFVYAFRIMRLNRTSIPADGLPHAPWARFMICSITAAYLHYFAVISVFLVNLALLCFLIAHRRTRKGDLKTFWIQAALQVALFAPWLSVLASQVGVVSNTYWAQFTFPDTLIALARYPLITMQIDFAWKGDYGLIPRIVVWVVIIALAILIALIVRECIKRKRRPSTRKRAKYAYPKRDASWWRRAWRTLTSPSWFPAFLGIAIYVGLGVIAGLASILMHSFMVYFRYMFCAIGPLIFGIAWILFRLHRKRITIMFCLLFIAISSLNQLLIVQDDYSDKNNEFFDYMAEQIQEGDMVVSSDIGIMGVTSVYFPDLEQHYLDWQKGNWALAYSCYGDNLVIDSSWETMLNDYHGQFWVLGQSTDAVPPRDVTDLEQKDGITLLWSQQVYRPYERGYYTIALMYKE